MKGAELDTKRRSLGLSVRETAELLDVTERTLNYWIEGKPSVNQQDPEAIVERLTELEVAMGDLVDTLVEDAHQREAKIVTLTRYRSREELDRAPDNRGLPLGAHAMAISWAIDDLRCDGHEVRVEWATLV